MSGKARSVVRTFNSVALPVEPPSRFMITPWGLVSSKKGDFLIDDEAAAAIVADFQLHGVDIPIDRDHQSVSYIDPAPDGSRPAMGWIKSLSVVSGEGIYAEQVEWNEIGAGLIRTKQYRYISPAWLGVEGAERPDAIHSVALTNRPAINGMRPVVNTAEPDNGDSNMTEYQKLMERLRKLVPHTAADANEDTLITALSAPSGDAEKARAFRGSVCKAVKLDETKTHSDDDILGSLGKIVSHADDAGDKKPDAANALMQAQVTDLGTEVKALRGENRTLTCKAFMDECEGKGQVSAHSAEPLRAMFMDDPEKAKAAVSLVPEGTYPSRGRVTSHAAPDATPGDASRGSLVAQGKDEFRKAMGGMPCTEREYVDQLLSEHSEGPLGDEEVKTHNLAGC